MAEVGLYMGLLVGFLTLSATLAVLVFPRLRSDMECRQGKILNQIRDKYKGTEWTADSIMQMVDSAIELRKIEQSHKREIGTLKALLVFVISILTIGLGLTLLEMYLEVLKQLDVFLAIGVFLFIGRWVPILYRMS